MRRAVGVRKLRDELSLHVGYVRRGGRIVITDRGKPIALLLPYRQAEDSDREHRLRTLLSSPHVAPAERPFRRQPPAVRGRGRLASRLIVEDRR